MKAADESALNPITGVSTGVIKRSLVNLLVYAWARTTSWPRT